MFNKTKTESGKDTSIKRLSIIYITSIKKIKMKDKKAEKWGMTFGEFES